MKLLVVCGRCGRKLRAPEAAAGKRVRCPACRAVVDVPADDLAVAPVGPEPVPAAPWAAGPDLHPPATDAAPRAPGRLSTNRSAYIGAASLALAGIASAAAYNYAALTDTQASAALVASAVMLWGVISGAWRGSARLVLAAVAGAAAAGALLLVISLAAEWAALVFAPAAGWYAIIVGMAGSWAGLIAAGAAFGAFWGHAEGSDVGAAAGARAGARAGLWCPVIMLVVVLAVALPVAAVGVVLFWVAGNLLFAILAVLVVIAAQLAILPVSGYIAAMHFALDIEAAARRSREAVPFVPRAWQRGAVPSPRPQA